MNGAGSVDARVWREHFGTEFENSDQLTIDVTRDYEGLRQPFTPASSPIAIAPGGYTFSDVAASYAFGAQRPVSGTITVRTGAYSADRAFSTNLRFRWEYAPGSGIFLVYTDERDVTDDRLATPTTVRGLKNRSVIMNVNRLLRF